MAKGTTERISTKAKWITGLLIFAGFGMVLVSLIRWQLVRGERAGAKLSQ